MLTPPSMETIFLALSGLILVAGVLYWFWSHLQLTQKKVQLLENAVFELRGMLASSGGGSAGPPVLSLIAATAPVPPAAAAAAYNDLADDGWEDEGAGATADTAEVVPKSTPLDLPEAPATPSQIPREIELNIDELAPGGRIQIGEEKEVTTSSDEFRELFISGGGEMAPVATMTRSGSGSGETLEGMPVRELRRLAEQRGIRGVADMKKKELLAALRQQVVAGPMVAATAAVEREEVAATAVVDDAEILE